MAGLVGVRAVVSGYVEEAERVGTWKWLDKGRGEGEGGGDGVVGREDEVLVTWFGEEEIGTVVFRGVREGPSDGGGGGSATGAGSSPRKTKKQQQQQQQYGPTKGVIRAWTVKRKYRGKGVGTALLEDVVQACREKGWSGPVFAHDHANSHRVLWSMFNSGFEKRDRKARETLEKVIEASEGGGNAGRRKK